MEGVWLAEAKLNLLVGVFVVDVAHGVKFVLNLLSVKRIKIHLGVLLSVQSHSGVLSNDGGWENLKHNINL